MALVEQNFSAVNGGGSTLMIDATAPRIAAPTNGTNGISKLSQLQARFQQRQLQEKEQKLLRLYENQQQRAFQRVSRGSAGSSSVSSTTSSTTSSSSLGNGKVRQLFDERRTQKPSSKSSGWDRSYPLEPLEPTRVRQNRSTGLTRGASLERINNQPSKKIVSRSRSQVRPGNLVNGGYVERSRQPQDYRSSYADEEYTNYSQDELDTPYYNRDRNSNRFTDNQDREIEQLFTNSRPNLYDNETPLRDGETFDESQLFKKLTNVGGILLMKERTMNEDKYKTYNANSRRVPLAPKTAREEANQRVAALPARRRENDAEPRSPPSRTITKPAVKRFEPTVSPPASNGSIGRKGVPPKSVNAASPPLRTVSNTTNKAAPVTSTPRANSSKPAATKAAPASRPSPRQPTAVPDNLSECTHCGRRFASDRVQMHQDICARTKQKKRKVYDPVKQRVKGTEAEAYVKIASKQQQKQAKEPAPKKSDWRRKHEEFINAIRAAKEVKAHLAAGGKLSDLPPPPPSENLDYVQCPHCSRRFNEAAAERHIPRCADMQHNKPKPKAQPAKVGGPFAKKR